MRLIDADELIETMKKVETDYEDAMTCPSWWTAYSVVSEQPTAYDVDKVVEELKKATQYVDLSNPSSPISHKVSAIHPSVAIDIVKSGGVE